MAQFASIFEKAKLSLLIFYLQRNSIGKNRARNPGFEPYCSGSATVFEPFKFIFRLRKGAFFELMTFSFNICFGPENWAPRILVNSAETPLSRWF